MKKVIVSIMVPVVVFMFVGYVLAGVPNPAAVYCKDMGFESRVVMSPDGGQHSICIFPDGECDAWDFLEGLCGVNHSYCSQQGYNLVVKDDGQDPFSNPYAACVDPTTGREVGSVTGLLGYPDLLNRGMWPQEPVPVPSSVQGLSTQGLLGPMITPLLAPLPSSFDWRSYNGSDWMTSVKDQSQCGSCWFFSAVGAVEAAYNIYYSNPNLALNLSEEYGTANCNGNGDGGCCGGFNDHALASIKNSGTPDEACMPYNVATYNTSICGCFPTPPCAGTCPNGAGTNSCALSLCSNACTDVGSRLIKIKDYHSAGSDTDTMKQNLMDHGPLSVCLNFDGYFDTTVNAPYGVYKCTSSATDHCVVIVGWDDTISAWIIKNSWGSTDGPHHNGYREVGYDQCGINSAAFWVEPADLVFPVAKCKDVTESADSTCHATASIDDGSYDPNGASVTLSQVPTTFDLGTTTATLTVKDPAGLTASCTGNVTVSDDTPPEITCPPAITLECTGPSGATGTFAPTATDNCGVQGTTCNPPSGSTFPFGTTAVSCSATDTSGNTSTACVSSVTVVDTAPPSIASATASPNELWPPNHKMAAVKIEVSVSDVCDTTPSCHITSVSSNEPENGLGDGDTAPDWEITGDLSVNLRAERSGTGTGRLYTINVECTDQSGNSSTATVGVTVPHSKGK
jgi:C1A family cysteine protease/putative hemolysin